MNGNVAGLASPSVSNAGPVAGPSSSNGRQQRHHHQYNPHHTPTFYPQQGYGGYAAPSHQHQQHPGFSNPYGNAPPGGYAGYEFIPQQQVYMQQYSGGGYAQMGGYYTSNPSGPMGMPMGIMHQQHPGMMQGMQNGPPPLPLQQGGRFPPVFTPQQGNGPVNGVNGHASPYPAYQHPSTSPALSNSVPPTSPPPNGPTYPSHDTQNPYAHLQHHAQHHNPYASMAPATGHPGPYTNGYQPFTPIHPPPPQAISPGAMHMHPQPTLKMNSRTSYGYPVGNVGGALAPRKPLVGDHETSVPVPADTVNGNGKTTPPVKEEEKKEDIVDEEGSDSEPVFASINQEVEQAKKSRHERKVSSSVDGEEVPKSSNGPTSDPAVPSPEARESPVTEAPPAPVISDSFIDSADATTTDRPQSVLWTSLGRPYPVTEAPGVVFHRRTAVPGRLYPVIKSWESIERPQGKERKVVLRREQVRAVAWRGKRRVQGERVFGEVTPEMVAEIKEQQTPQQQEEAKPAETAIEERLEAPVPQPTVEATPILRIPSPPAEETASPTATSPEPAPAAESAPAPAPSSEPASTPAPAPKAAPKSWAALLRTASKPSSSTPAIAAPSSGSVPSSNITSPRLAASAVVEQVAGTTEGSEQTIVVVPTEGSASAPAPTPPQVPAKPANAWGSRPMIVPDQLDLGKLLAEGLDERTRASLKKVTSVPRGLINTGNMCFANSILQVLAYCVPFALLLEELGKRSTADLGRRTPLTEALIIFLREFAATDSRETPVTNAQLSASEKQRAQSGQMTRAPFVPAFVYEAMKENKRFDSMRRGHQEDAEEFFGFLLETVHEEFLYMQSRYESRHTGGGYGRVSAKADAAQNGEEREVSRPVSPGAAGGDGWLEVGKKQKVNVVRTTESKDSAVSRLFGGKLRSVLHTPGQKDSITLEPYQPLQLDISAPSVHTLTDALHRLHEPEVIPGVWSASKGVNVDATKQVFVENVPPILILHLKRFLYDAEQQRVVKKSKPVAYASELTIPNEILSPARRVQGKSLKYKLFGVVYHHGTSATGGHYTAAVLRQDASGWLHLDDESVEEVGEEEVVVGRDAAERGQAGDIGRGKREKCAYLLFYQRVD